jgi:hypothetical protein
MMVWYGMVKLYLMTLAPTAISWFPRGASNINYLQKRNIYIINVTGVTGVTTNII